MRNTWRFVVGELFGSALLAGVVVASGIAGDTLAPGLPAVALLCNSLATAGALYLLIYLFSPVSGAHFNPLVTAFAVRRRDVPLVTGAAMMCAQVLGCSLGVVLANVSFARPLVTLSHHVRDTNSHLLAEGLATAGLLFVITALIRQRRLSAAPLAVSIYIGVAYFACSSTSFANPAITVGRMLTDSFAGIAPHSVVPFVIAQLVGGIVGWKCAELLVPSESETT